MENINEIQKQTVETVKGSLGIFAESEEVKTLKEILDIFADNNCVTLESTKPFEVSKIYNNFSWYTYNTKETKGKFGVINKSEQILVFKESFEDGEYDEDIEAVSVVFEISVENIEEVEFIEFEQIMKIYLDNGIMVKMYYV